MSDPLSYPCGCKNTTDAKWGVQRSLTKCEFHRSESGKSGLAHHRVMGAINAQNEVQHGNYWRELIEPLKELGFEFPKKRQGNVLEIACGVGAYVPELKRRYRHYFAIEPDTEVAEFTRKKLSVAVDTRTFERYLVRTRFDLIFAAHVFEHMEDAPAMMDKARRLLNKDGRLIIIIPNDEDPVNPDHLWYFTPDNLRSTLEKIGFRDVRMTMRRMIEREQFIYCVATK